MSEHAFKEQLNELLADTFDIDEDEISAEMNSDNVESWDSLNHLRLVSALEKEFDISLTMDEINAMLSYEKIVELVSKHLGS
ncbi:MAG: acyl carrier protein [Gammaproteobacteria bacterium]|nr:acyl carrier protein [Gammaproteobacteria bacterium]